MTNRTIDDWTSILGQTDATHCSAEMAIADRILGDLLGYSLNSKHRAVDTAELAIAIQAYAKMIQVSGIIIA